MTNLQTTTTGFTGFTHGIEFDFTACSLVTFGADNLLFFLNAHDIGLAILAGSFHPDGLTCITFDGLRFACGLS